MKVAKAAKQKRKAGARIVHLAQDTDSTQDAARQSRARDYITSTRQQFAVDVERARRHLTVCESGALAGPMVGIVRSVGSR